MKQTKHQFEALLAVCLLTLCALATSARAADLTESDQQFLAKYEKIHAALVVDDLAGAKKAAIDLGSGGAEMAQSESLDGARAAFVKLSDQAVKIAAGQPGYYILYCPMVKHDWVQTTNKVANPYAGKEMVACGEIRK
jgi:hypothetical protein